MATGIALTDYAYATSGEALANLWILGAVALLLGTSGVAGAALIAGPGVGAMGGMAGCAQMHAQCRGEMAQCAEHSRTGDHSGCAMAGMSPEQCAAMHSSGMMTGGSSCH